MWTDEQAEDGRAYGHVTTEFSGMDDLPHFLSCNILGSRFLLFGI